jgi:hypothetical protein
MVAASNQPTFERRGWANGVMVDISHQRLGSDTAVAIQSSQFTLSDLLIALTLRRFLG